MSYIMGMIAALPEFSSRIYAASRPFYAALACRAPNKGRFVDGYDKMADFAGNIGRSGR